MKISGSYNVQKMNTAYGKSVAKTKKAEGVKMASDKIEISEAAKDYQVAMKAVKEVPNERTELVNKLKQQIKEGTYNPSASDVVDKMMASITGNKMG